LCIVVLVPADAAAMSTIAREWLQPALRLGAALLVGAAIGWERQKRGRPAGLRTHMLVGVGSAVVVMIFAGESMDATSHVVQGVATGVGFLCAGDILHHVRAGEERVTGLTSAAALWVTSALGMAAATGRWAVTALGSFATLLTLTLMNYVEKLIPGQQGDGLDHAPARGADHERGKGKGA
jgi:putative Mg2+ transporter-C (MgtC) family protein